MRGQSTEQLQPKDYLKDGKGIAFGIALEDEPDVTEGGLHPFGAVKIAITGYNNMSGRVEDTLHLQISNLGSFSFPVSIGVVGSPLSIFPNSFGLSLNSGIPCIRWGVVAPQETAHQRVLKIMNNCPAGMNIEIFQ